MVHFESQSKNPPESRSRQNIYCVYLSVLVAVILWLTCSVDISLSCDFALLPLLSISRAHSPSSTLASTVRLLFLQLYFYHGSLCPPHTSKVCKCFMCTSVYVCYMKKRPFSPHTGGNAIVEKHHCLPFPGVSAS